jgi:ABC-2 type transport system permease protein
MNAVFAIARREFDAYLASPIGWICLTAFSLLNGFFFVLIMWSYVEYTAQAMFNPGQADSINVNDQIEAPLFSNMSVIALFMVPALTMRLIADDRRSRAIDLLLTSPITSWQITTGKYLGALAFAAALVVTTLHFPAFLFWLGEPDTNVVYAQYASFFLLLATFMATGLFASSLTDNQLVALVLGFGINLFLWIVGWSSSVADEGTIKTLIEAFAMVPHVERLGKGLLHVKDIVYFVTFIGLCLFATAQRVEALRWR